MLQSILLHCDNGAQGMFKKHSSSILPIHRLQADVGM